MQVMNLVREFELQRVKESETIKKYSDRLLNLANHIRLLGSTFNDLRIVEKILATTPERFESTITTLENTKDLSKITLAELLSAFQAEEQRRVMRQGGAIEGSLSAKHHDDGHSMKKKNKKYQPTDEEGAAQNNKNKTGGFKGNYLPCKHCGKLGHVPLKCWERPDAKCTKCNHLGHEAIICKNKTQQQDAEAQVVDEQEEHQLFVTLCLTSSVSSNFWSIDSRCTNHMTCDRDILKYLSPTRVITVRIGHGELPLLKEDIPPDDEGWLCLGCDCKVDYIDFINNLQGKDLSIADSWEKVYPKDVAATYGEKLDDISGLPSDDSENGLPDIPCPNEIFSKHLGEEISSPKNDLVLSRNNFGLAKGGGLCSLNGFQNMNHLEYDYECKLYLESNILVQKKEMPKSINADKLSKLKLENACDEQRENATQSDELPLPSNSQLAQVESCQILSNNSMGDSALTQFGDPCCRTSAVLQEIQKTTSSSSTEEKLKVRGMSTSESHLSGKRKAYGEVTTKRLCESFKENNYPNYDGKKKFDQSGGWIKALPEEAENERMHLINMVELVQPKWYARLLVITVQGEFFNFYFVLYLLFPKLAHRVVGHLEEEAIHSYTLYLNDIDHGEIQNSPSPAIAIDYWRLPKDATLKDVDETDHRDVNHFASPWETYQANLSIDLRKNQVPKKFLDKIAY
ncbi:Ubiquinol oxidase 2, mitochondrial [Capsicum annuum]|nr:Ubiquinol oxidase 2, mitochondrial [Capsicum annuum]